MKTILLVDDDARIRNVLSRGLSKAGYQVVEAADGNEALKLFDQRPADLVITDLVMPEKEGIELITALRKRRTGLRIIAISGGGRNSPESYLGIAKVLGAFQTLAKPIHHQDLLAAVDAAFSAESKPALETRHLPETSG